MKGLEKGGCVLALTMAAGLAYGTRSAAQMPLKLALSPGTAGPAFIKVEAVRELQDGRTLVIDSRERSLMIVDWAPLNRRQSDALVMGLASIDIPAR